MHLNTTVDQAACQLLCRCTQSTLPAFAELYRLLRVTLSKELAAVMFEMHLISGITDGWQVCELPPCQAKCKIRAQAPT